MRENIQIKAIKKLLGEIEAGRLMVKHDSKIYRKHKNGKTKHAEYLSRHGYYRISTYIEKIQVFVMSHRLLFAYYHGFENLDPTKTIHHIDYNKTNNKKYNLEQVTREENASDGSLRYSNTKNTLIIGNGIRIENQISKKIRKSKLPREYIQNKLGVSANTLSNWSKGHTYPTMDKAYELADLLEVNINELYERIKDEDNSGNDFKT